MFFLFRKFICEKIFCYVSKQILFALDLDVVSMVTRKRDGFAVGQMMVGQCCDINELKEAKFT
jgi:hypothetical protein